MVNVTDWRAPIALTVLWLALRSGRLVSRLPESSVPHDVGAQPSSIKMTPSLPNESTEKDDTTAAYDGGSNEEYPRDPYDVYSSRHPGNTEESSAVSKKPEPTTVKPRPSFDSQLTETLAPAIDSPPSSLSPKSGSQSYRGSAPDSTITIKDFKPYAMQAEASSMAPSFKSGSPGASLLLPSPMPAPSVSLHSIANTQSQALATPEVLSADVVIPAARGSRPIRNVSVPSYQRISTGHLSPESAPRKAPELSTTLPALVNRRKRTPDRPNPVPAANDLRNATMPGGKGARDKCTLERFFCRVPSAACSSGSRKKAPCVKKLFITGTAGSGTHYVAHYLSKISGKQITVKHEGPGSRTDVLVSWPSRCPGPDKLDFKALGFPEAKLLKPPMVQWANKQLGGRCMFSAVVHLVRHPLRFLSSNFAFGACTHWATRCTKHFDSSVLHGFFTFLSVSTYRPMLGVLGAGGASHDTFDCPSHC